MNHLLSALALLLLSTHWWQQPSYCNNNTLNREGVCEREPLDKPREITRCIVDDVGEGGRGSAKQRESDMNACTRILHGNLTQPVSNVNSHLVLFEFSWFILRNVFYLHFCCHFSLIFRLSKVRKKTCFRLTSLKTILNHRNLHLFMK